MADAVMDFAAVENAPGADDAGLEQASQGHEAAGGDGAARDGVNAEARGEREAESEDGKADAAKLDGRRGLHAHREAAKAAAEHMPEHAQAIKEMAANSFRLHAYQQHFAKPEEAAAVKQLVDGVGGVQGISELQQRVQQVELQDAGLKEGNPEVLDAMFRDFPEGAAALAPHYLDRLARSSPEAFGRAVVPYVVDILESAGVGGHLNAILQEPNPARRDSLVQELAVWFQNQRQGANQLRQQPARHPAEERIRQREQELNAREEQSFKEGVSAKVNAAVSPEIDRAVDAYARQYKLNATQKTHFKTTLQQRLVDELTRDQGYVQQVKLRNAQKGRTHDSLASFISGEFNRRLKDAAFSVARDVYGAARPAAGGGSGVVKPNQAKTAPGGGPLFVSQRPPNAELDLSRKDAELLMVKGQGYRKADGMFVTWRR